MSAARSVPTVGVIGGSGLYELLDDAEERHVRPPYGPASDAVVVGPVDGRAVAFLPRHGRGHRLPPHRVPYRANLWALASLGVQQVLAASAVGSLRRDLPPGTFVAPDQVVDRTWGRAHTFFDDSDEVGHASLADPYCAVGRATLLRAGADRGTQVVDGGTLVVVNGPRFSTRAESVWHAAQGWSVVGMTGMPEAALARELGLCYTTVGMVTDLDAGLARDSAVDQEGVLAVFAANVAHVRDLVLAAAAALPERDAQRGMAAGGGPHSCGCPEVVRPVGASSPRPGRAEPADQAGQTGPGRCCGHRDEVVVDVDVP